MTPPPTDVTTAPLPRTPFKSSFWMFNIIEMWERLAYYTLAVMAPIYVAQADDPGGLQLTQWHKGTIILWWTAISSLLPTVTGGIADRYGYKRILALSFTLMTGGYLIIALCRDLPGFTHVPNGLEWNYYFYFMGMVCLATGTALFKPALQGSLALSMGKGNSSAGWSIFYMVVNVGAFIGHFMPAVFMSEEHTREAWRNLFLASAAISSLNFLMLFTFKDIPSGASKTAGIWTVLTRTITNLADRRLIAWLLIMSGFWMMMYQLWDLMPNFIPDWIDSGPLANALHVLPDGLYKALVDENNPRGPQVPQNILLSMNSLLIIFGVVFVGYITRKMRTLTAMLWGMLSCALGVLLAGLTMNPWFLLTGLVFFSIGEMSTGPKKSEYLALIAPIGKVGLYLGYVNIPVGIGRMIGSKLSAYVYGHFGEKATLALKYLQQHTAVSVGNAWDGNPTHLEAALGISRSDAMDRLCAELGKDHTAVTQLLWDTYNPQYLVWIPFAATGVICAIALAIFGHMAKKWKDMNA